MAKSAKHRGKDHPRKQPARGLARDQKWLDFDHRLGRARSRNADAPDTDAKARGSAMGTAFRIASELVAGLVVGGFIGWQLDKWLDTSPVMLLVFFMLGSAAGILNVIRTALQMQAKARDAEAGSGKPDA